MQRDIRLGAVNTRPDDGTAGISERGAIRTHGHEANERVHMEPSKQGCMYVIKL